MLNGRLLCMLLLYVFALYFNNADARIKWFFGNWLIISKLMSNEQLPGRMKSLWQRFIGNEMNCSAHVSRSIDINWTRSNEKIYAQANVYIRCPMFIMLHALAHVKKLSRRSSNNEIPSILLSQDLHLFTVTQRYFYITGKPVDDQNQCLRITLYWICHVLFVWKMD